MKTRWLNRFYSFGIAINQSLTIGFPSKPLDLFMEKRIAGVSPSHVDFSTILGICGRERLTHLGSMIHGLILKIPHFNSQNNPDFVVVLNSLISMYSKCGNLQDSTKIFERMKFRDVVSWNSMISASLRVGDFKTGFGFFKQMKNSENTQFDQATLTTILSVCDGKDLIFMTMVVHSLVFLNGFEREISVGNALITGYIRCGSFDSARQVFGEIPQRNVITWTAMISGFSQFDLCEESLYLFKQMIGSNEKIIPNSSTFSSSLLACSVLRALREGQQIHGIFVKTGNQSDLCVESALMDMYSKCCNMEDACKIFYSADQVDVVSMTVILVGLCQNGREEEALQLFLKLMRENVEIDATIVSSVLGVFSSDPSLALGQQIHSLVIKKCLFENIFVGNGLINMYSKCGDLIEAIKLFDEMPQRNSVSWNSMISGLARHGHAFEALQLFDEMELAGVEPTDITFLSLLHACSHVGVIEKGMKFLESMFRDYGMSPRVKHYACVVDMLGRAGYLTEAKNFIEGLPIEPGVLVWQALLGACSLHGNVEMGRYAAEHLFLLAPGCSSSYVLLSNIYSIEGRWEDRARVIKAMKEMGVKKETGISWIEIDKKVHSFAVEDRLHPQAEQIYDMLDVFTALLKEEGYIPGKRFVLYDLRQDAMVSSSSISV